MERMTCTECAAESFSAAAKTLIETGDRCPVCGGELALQPREPVTVPAGAPADEADSHGD
jgi:hypothetical protein